MGAPHVNFVALSVDTPTEKRCNRATSPSCRSLFGIVYLNGGPVLMVPSGFELAKGGQENAQIVLTERLSHRD